MNTQTSQSGILPRFYMDAKQHKRRSEQEGRPIFIEKEFIEIRIAGDSKTVVVKEVDDTHKRRWPEQYNAFKLGQEQPVEGTPIEHCPAFNVAEVAQFKALSIRTIEALSELNEAGIHKLGMNGRSKVAKAKAFLKSAEGSSEAIKLTAENERLTSEVELLKEQIKELASIVKPANQETAVEAVVEDAPPSLDFDSLSKRTKTALGKVGIESAEDLGSLTPDELSDLPGVGLTAIDEISKLLEAA